MTREPKMYNVRIMHSLIINREGLILTLSIQSTLRGWISQYLPSLGGVGTFSHRQTFYREWISKSFPADREGLTVLKSILPC